MHECGCTEVVSVCIGSGFVQITIPRNKLTAVIIFQTLAGNNDIFITRNTIKDPLLCTPTEETELCVSAKVVLVSPHCVPYFIHDTNPILNLIGVKM